MFTNPFDRFRIEVKANILAFEVNKVKTVWVGSGLETMKNIQIVMKLQVFAAKNQIFYFYEDETNL